jgi:chemotaxis protein methyltransferase WspC
MNPETAIAELVEQASGLDTAAMGPEQFGQALRFNMRRAGVEGPERYLDVVRGSREELECLIAELAVPETWFFRDAEPFAFLARHVREVWLPHHSGEVLRVLSAPCSTGEEPYSIAIALLEAGLPRERFRIVAADVSRARLEFARAAVFPKNSFRERTDHLRRDYFTAEGDRFRLRDDVVAAVDFRPANLRSPAFLEGEPPYDAVFCRNLLIYLVPEARQQMLGHMGRLLAPDGVLITGHSEVVFFLQNGYAPVAHPRAFACRKASPAAVPTPRPRPVSVPRRRAAATEAVKPLDPSQLALARRLADSGSLEEAAALCDRLLREGENAEACFLLGVIHEASNRLGPAEECFRRTLYLEPNHEESLLHMTLLLERKGETEHAGVFRSRLRRRDAVKGASHA